jgi:hypothetical protein
MPSWLVMCKQIPPTVNGLFIDGRCAIVLCHQGNCRVLKIGTPSK